MSKQLDVRVISIGTLPAHPLWGERQQARTGHSTTTLIAGDNARVVVDPGLPGAALTARLSERAGLAPEDITHVFLTSFRPDTRRGIGIFSRATWLISEGEREAVGVPLAARLRDLADDDQADEALRKVLAEDIAVLQRCTPAEDSIAPSVDLFPLPGVSPGMCGLLVAQARHTTLVCGDAIPTVEHLERGMVMQGAVDLDRARESFKEAVEIADLLVLGRDNMVVNPTRGPW
ncbi:MAG: MBL fold metallo-hydrolase [Phycisphaerales bacterium]|nr:MAG: MBL fold metallo-hydrolase [Phycisphaerales bacterium]